MDSELKSMLDRASELLKELKDEYESSFETFKVTDKAKNLTHEILEKLRHALDHTMSRAWEKFIAPNLSKEKRETARVFFPIGKNLHALASILGQARIKVKDLEKNNKALYDFLLKKQPFSAKENKWLELLSKISGKGKHFRLAPQKRIQEIKSIEVSTVGGSKVKWNPSAVKFGKGIKVLGAPIDAKTQRVVPTAFVVEKVEAWVSFMFDGYGVNAFKFCNEAYTKTRALIEEMVKAFKL